MQLSMFSCYHFKIWGKNKRETFVINCRRSECKLHFARNQSIGHGRWNTYYKWEKKMLVKSHSLPSYSALYLYSSNQYRTTHANEDDSVKIIIHVSKGALCLLVHPSKRLFFRSSFHRVNIQFKSTIIKLIVIRGFLNMTALYISHCGGWMGGQGWFE